MATSLQLSLHCKTCGRWYQLPATWPVDRDLRYATEEYATYVLPCGHTPDPEQVGGTWFAHSG